MNSRWLWCLTLFNPIYNTAFLLVPSPFSHRIGFVGKNYSETPKISGWWFEALWKIWKSVGIVIPNIWKVIKAMFQTTNQIWIGKFGTPDKPWKTMENPDFHCRFSQHFTNPLRTSGPFGTLRRPNSTCITRAIGLTRLESPQELPQLWQFRWQNGSCMGVTLEIYWQNMSANVLYTTKMAIR